MRKDALLASFFYGGLQPPAVKRGQKRPKVRFIKA